MDKLTMNSLDVDLRNLEEAMEGINRSVKGLPGKTGLGGQHKKLAKLVATLHTELRWAKSRAIN